MIEWAEVLVGAERARTPGAVWHDATDADGQPLRVLSYLGITGELVEGVRVLVNATALRRGLGTGGVAMVVAPVGRVPHTGRSTDSPGHLVKARYSPTQTMVLGADEQDSPHHLTLRDADDLDGMPVVVADLHSALPAILVGLRERRPDAKVAYIMTDGGALPIAFSRTVARLRELGWIADAVTVGQAFGGDLETVNVHTGLLAAHLVTAADVAIVTQGPGNLGTGTRWGFSGTSAGEVVNAAHVLNGRPIASLRVSQADGRKRHFGISHHSQTAYGRVALAPADVPVPLFEGPVGDLVREQAGHLRELSEGRLRLHPVPTGGLGELLRSSPVPLSTMGRRYDDDRAAFLAAAAAGRYAAGLLTGR